ncbi:cytidine deaminase [Thermogemmatispora sp.]|uniref:cytidine deaminase n=1 Tax=Thermogemmatispora sp. TaxID=1968838 RepID=UPI0033903DD1
MRKSHYQIARRRSISSMTSAQSAVPEREELLTLARAVALQAHAPYSHFRVGAVVVADGQLYRGVNVEISSYGLTLCAERAALAAAVSAGARRITHVAVACIDAPPTAPASARTPCGACRQWLADLAPQAVVYIDGLEESLTVKDLLPYAFAL